MPVSAVLLIVLLHFIGDFVLQPRSIATNKSSSLKHLGYHMLILQTTFMVGIWHYTGQQFTGDPAGFVFCNSMAHGVTDYFTWRFYKLTVYLRDRQATKETWKYWEDWWFYTTIGIDQAIHMATAFGLYYYFLVMP
jgi:hypothetical protein